MAGNRDSRLEQVENAWKWIQIRREKERERERERYLASSSRSLLWTKWKTSRRSMLIFSLAFICSLFESKRAIRWKRHWEASIQDARDLASSVIRYRKRVIYHSMLSWRSLILFGSSSPFRDRGRWKSRRISLKKVDGWTSWALAVEEKQKNIGEVGEGRMGRGSGKGNGWN